MPFTVEQLMEANIIDNEKLMLILEKNKGKTIDDLFLYDEESDCMTIILGGLNYHIRMNKIKNKDDLLEWVEHLTHKNFMNAYLIGEFINHVYKIKARTGW